MKGLKHCSLCIIISICYAFWAPSNAMHLAQGVAWQSSIQILHQCTQQSCKLSGMIEGLNKSRKLQSATPSLNMWFPPVQPTGLIHIRETGPATTSCFFNFISCFFGTLQIFHWILTGIKSSQHWPEESLVGTNKRMCFGKFVRMVWKQRFVMAWQTLVVCFPSVDFMFGFGCICSKGMDNPRRVEAITIRMHCNNKLMNFTTVRPHPLENKDKP